MSDQKTNEVTARRRAVSVPPFEDLVAKAPDWIQDPLPIEFPTAVPAEPVGPNCLTAFCVVIDDNLKPTIYLDGDKWPQDIVMVRDATPFDLDVVNLYLQKYKESR